MKALFLIGRIAFGGLFVYNGINHFRQRKALIQYTAAKDVPEPEMAVTASGVAMLVGGSSIILGLQPKLGALAIAGFLAAASPMMHDYWTVEDPAQRQNDFIHFSKNIALMGAALALMAVPEPWPASLGCRK